MNTEKIKPPTYLLIAILIEIVSGIWLPVMKLIPPPWTLLGLIPLTAGVVINLRADRVFHLAGTTINPFKTPSVLVTDGLFRWTRNPMYLGFCPHPDRCGGPFGVGLSKYNCHSLHAFHRLEIHQFGRAEAGGRFWYTMGPVQKANATLAVKTRTKERFSMKTILVVDDEPKITKLLRDYLERAGYGVRTAADGKLALSLARAEKPDLILLDLGLPKMDGLDVTRELRKISTVPIIMLTARSEESDKLVGLELGADDYITKPFSPKEVVARVRAVFRRMENYSAGSPETIHVAGLTLDLPRMRVSAEGREIEELTPSEFQLLAEMARYPGRVFTRAQLLEALRGVAFESYERAIDAHIKNIRHKIEPNPSEPRHLLTVYGVGYKFTDR